MNANSKPKFEVKEFTNSSKKDAMEGKKRTCLHLIYSLAWDCIMAGN